MLPVNQNKQFTASILLSILFLIHSFDYKNKVEVSNPLGNKKINKEQISKQFNCLNTNDNFFSHLQKFLNLFYKKIDYLSNKFCSLNKKKTLKNNVILQQCRIDIHALIILLNNCFTEMYNGYIYQFIENMNNEQKMQQKISAQNKVSNHNLNNDESQELFSCHLKNLEKTKQIFSYFLKKNKEFGNSFCEMSSIKRVDSAQKLKTLKKMKQNLSDLLDSFEANDPITFFKEYLTPWTSLANKHEFILKALLPITVKNNNHEKNENSKLEVSL